MKIEIEESVLESIKAQVQRLQEERDELLHQLIISRDIVFDSFEAFGPCDHSVGICNCDMERSIQDSDSIISRCTTTPKVME